MKRTALAASIATVAVLALAGCGGDDDSASASATPAASSSSVASPSSTAPAVDSQAQQSCLKAGLDFVPLNAAVRGSDADLKSYLSVWRPSTYTASTALGQTVVGYLQQVNQQVTVMKAQLASGQAPDRASFNSAFASAQSACRSEGATL